MFNWLPELEKLDDNIFEKVISSCDQLKPHILWDIETVLRLEYNDLLIRWLYLLDWLEDIHFDDFITELEFINKSDKFDITREINYLKANCVKNSKCFLNFNIVYGSPSCTIYFKDNLWLNTSINVKFAEKNSN